MAKLFTHVDKDNDTTYTDGDDIMYLLLLESCPKNGDNTENYKYWEFVKGRQAVYDYIKDLLLEEDDESVDCLLDIDKSLIYADNPHIPPESNKLKLSNGINLYRFMKDCFVLQKVKDEGGFDIEEFHTSVIEDEDE